MKNPLSDLEKNEMRRDKKLYMEITKLKFARNTNEYAARTSKRSFRKNLTLCITNYIKLYIVKFMCLISI